MDWGIISGLAALCGVIINFIRIGRWQGSIETRVGNLEKVYDSHDSRMETLTNLITRQNDLLTELKVKFEMVFDVKTVKKKVGGR